MTPGSMGTGACYVAALALLAWSSGPLSAHVLAECAVGLEAAAVLWWVVLEVSR